MILRFVGCLKLTQFHIVTEVMKHVAYTLSLLYGIILIGTFEKSIMACCKVTAGNHFSDMLLIALWNLP
ncbi:MAG: hypothetical protein WCB90_15020 [Methanosarcina sp.]|jgi:hypothetical protein